jgi:Lon protease-like protein
VISSPIPVFPLGLVLLPGATVPLHLFEPRYRAMLSDVSGTTQRFGLIATPADTAEADLPAGRIGCVALITAQETLPDGRSNIVIVGTDRFRFETYLETGTPYRVAHVVEWNDLPDEPLALTAAAARVRVLAHRVIAASMTLQDIPGAPPDPGDDPAALSFQIAQMLRMDNEALYRLLAERSAIARLLELESALGERLTRLETGAELHTRAKTNGHHHGSPPG